jgi:hypothetical protein
LKNRGAGQPDIGLLTKDQLKTKRGERKGPPQMPARGIIEAKCTAPDVGLTADGGGGLQVWQAFVAADGDEIGLPAGVVLGVEGG